MYQKYFEGLRSRFIEFRKVHESLNNVKSGSCQISALDSQASIPEQQELTEESIQQVKEQIFSEPPTKVITSGEISMQDVTEELNRRESAIESGGRPS